MFLLDKIDPTQTIDCFGVDIPKAIPELVSKGINLIMVAVPVLLVIYGMMDLGKAVMAQKDDEIKKGQQTFIKRLTAALVVFLVVIIVRMAIGIVADFGDDDALGNCFNQFINGPEEKTNENTNKKTE